MAGVACLVLVGQTPAAAHEGAVSLSAHARGHAVARLSQRLVGVGWDSAPSTARWMAALRPDLVRIDAGMERLYSRGPKLDKSAFASLSQEVRAARSIGARPVIILSYTPEWLADDRPSSDRTKVPPSDTAVWRRLVSNVVARLSALGVRSYEVWNEPDLPVFYQGLLTEFLERIFRPSAEAVLEIEKRSGRDLEFGGCACFFPDPSWIVPMIQYARANDLPLDFISWHHYGNTPFLGPDGAEPLGPAEIRPLLAPLRRRNPTTSPSTFGDQVAMVRSWRDALYSDSSRAPELWIDEWNLSAGGFDRRHDTAEAAAFQAAVLIELQRAGLDRASVFRSVDPAYGPDVVPAKPELYGGWGLVGRYGTIKPAWRAHRFWRSLGDDVLAFTSQEHARQGVSAMVTRATRRHFAVLVENFQAEGGHAHRIVLRLDGVPDGRWSMRSRGVDASDRRATVASHDGLTIPIDLSAQQAVLVELRLL